MNSVKIILSVAELIVLILFVGFFTSSETAYLSIPKIKLRTMVEEKRPFAKQVLKLKTNMERLLTTVLIGTNFFTALTSAIVTALVAQLLGQSPLRNLTPFITAFFITVFAQIIPKTIASLYPEKVASIFSIPLKTLQTVFFPVVWIFESLSRGVIGLVQLFSKGADNSITQEELKTLIDVGATEGTIEKDEKQILKKLIKFNNLPVSDIMKHRSFLSMVSVDSTVQQIIDEFINGGFSTLTVYKDSKENVVGVINYKSVLYGQFDSAKTVLAQNIMTPVMYIPGTLSVLEVLNKFRTVSYKFAVVLDEQGQTSGIVTMEDIMKFVFGRMTNENSYDALPPEEKIQLVSYKTFLVPGEMKIEEVNEILNISMESEEFNTVGGWVLEQFGHLPSIGEVLIKDKNLFIVEDIVQRRITSIKIKTK